MMRTVLIAGGAGFLGSHLCDFYISNGDKVVCIDNLSTGSKKNISHLVSHPDFNFVEADITEPLPEAITKEKFNLIVNMASPASPPQYQRLALETLLVGSQGVQRLLELARSNRARFFQASTSEVYGDAEVHPQPESYKGNVNSYGPRSMYDEAKRYAEALVYVYRKSYGVDTVIGRIFNTYGPRMDKDDGRVVSNLINQALQGANLTIYGDGKQTRSFCYVDDMVEAITKLINSGEEGPINIGNPSEFTINELAGIIVELTGSSSKNIYEELPGDDPLQRKPDISTAKKLLRWQPKIDLRTGLKQTISYFESQAQSSGLFIE